MKNKNLKKLIIYQAKNGAIEFRGDFERETIWATQKQIAEVFGLERSVVTKHIKNIFANKEVGKKSNVQKLHFSHSDKPILFYSLDIILAVGYRTNSSKAIEFRKWATKILKQYLVDGYIINKKRIEQNYEKFIKAVSNVKALLSRENKIKAEDILELISVFANTWFSLGAYDKDILPKKGISKKKIKITTGELWKALEKLKKDLIAKKQATDIFGKERNKKAIEGIIGNIFQSVFGKDVYVTNEEKAAHLLYFIVKNHPFIDGNKRSGAFAFVWFLRQAKLLRASLTAEALTALTLLIAESNPKDKEKMISLVLLLLQKAPVA